MDQYANNSEGQLLYSLLANPAGIGAANLQSLQQLVRSYPQSGILQALLVKAGGEQFLQQAAAAFDAQTLHSLVYNPGALHQVQPEQIIRQANRIGLKQYPATEPEVQPVVPVENEAESTAIYTFSESQDVHIVEDEHEPTPVQQVEDEPVAISNDIDINTPETPEPVAETATQVEWDINDTVLNEDEAEEEQPTALLPHYSQPEAIIEPGDIEDEVYDEIASIEDIAREANLPVSKEVDDAGFNDPVLAAETGQLVDDHGTLDNEVGYDDYGFDDDDLQLPEEEEESSAEPAYKLRDEADKLIVGNIAATDYFMFDRAFGRVEEAQSEKPAANAEPEPVKPVAEPAPQPPQGEQPAQDVTRYHDEQMPYSFLWWLDKTRREHSGIYRPYINTKPPVIPVQTVTDPALEHQYIENIFHITSVENLDRSTAQHVAANVKHKGDEIIERFIKEEPQIKPPSSDKLDTENKAKKSSEDAGELVTETLANIYADQMLYHKAIAIYKKLMLKFPEKSRYFADRIQSLEKKITI